MRSSFAFLAAAVLATLPTAGFSETFEVKLVNKSEEGNMAFEPSFLAIAPGDTVRFVATDKGHNAESIDTMLPEGAAAFAGKVGEELEVSFATTGLYGVKCKPHFSMGMVMTIAVGDVAGVPDGFLDGKLPKKAVERFEGQLAHLN